MSNLTSKEKAIEQFIDVQELREYCSLGSLSI